MTTFKKNLRVLGIDPGTATTGWAIIEKKENDFKAIAYGLIKTEKNKSDEKRILEISEDLDKIISKYHPQEAAVEKIYFFKNQKTVIEVGQSRGAIILTLIQKNIKLFNYTPLQVKQSMTGYGRAEKRQMQFMAKEILHLKKIPLVDDTADAIAIALCHLNSRGLINLVICPSKRRQEKYAKH
jgi:crossover junction endodeoxyribonuclease RuvC